MAANFAAESIKLKKMKLAEALCVRADLQKRIMQIEDRLKSVVKIQEGDEPDEDADNHFLRNRYFCY